jgi:hypothetical protein
MMKTAWILILLPLFLPHTSTSKFIEFENGEEITTAITLQVLEKSQSPSFFGGLKDVIIHFACFRPLNLEFDSELESNATRSFGSNISSSNSNSDEARLNCCQQFKESVVSLCDSESLPSFPSSLCMQLKEHEMMMIHGKCEHMAAPVPNLSNTFDPNGIVPGRQLEAILEPLMYLTLSAKLSFGNRRSSKTGKADAYSLVQYNNYNSNISRNKLWTQHPNAYSPLEIEGSKKPATCKKEKNIPISIVVESSLSNKGGMHRAFTHTVALHTTVDHLSKSFNGTVQGEINLILPQSQDIFMDVDDPFQKGEHGACNMIIANRPMSVQNSVINGNCHASLVSVTEEVIDIEQPAFVSPQHVVAIKIEFEGYVPNNFKLLGNKGGYIEIVLGVITNLHFRYPLTSDAGASSSLVPVHVPTPFLYDAKLIGTDGVVNVQSVQNCHTLSKGIAIKSGTGVSGSWENAIVEIAAGKDDHHGYVMIITVIVSLVGALIILFDMSKVSSWREKGLQRIIREEKTDEGGRVRIAAEKEKARLRAELLERLEDSFRKQEVEKMRQKKIKKDPDSSFSDVDNYSAKPIVEVQSSSLGQEVTAFLETVDRESEDLLQGLDISNESYGWDDAVTDLKHSNMSEHAIKRD